LASFTPQGEKNEKKKKKKTKKKKKWFTSNPTLKGKEKGECHR